MKKIVIVSITSLFQYYLFLSCLKKHNKLNYKFLILFNNLQISSETINEIKLISQNENFLFLDVRAYINKNLIFDNKNYVTVLKSFVKSLKISEIYLRYKLGLPERLLINLFPEAKLNFFEDGIGDYMEPKTYSGFKKNVLIKSQIKEFLLRNIYSFSRDPVVKNFYNHKQLNHRINNFYELITNNDGYVKNKILKYGIKKRVNISNNFKSLIRDQYEKFHKKLIIANSFIVLGHPFLHSYENNEKLFNEINLYNKIFNLIKIKLNNIDIVFKPHPKTPEKVLDLISNKFSKDIKIIQKNILSEFLIINENSKFLGAFLSSSLIYSNFMNHNIKPYFFDIKDYGVKEFDSQSKNMRNICKTYSIETFKIN